MIDFNRLRAGTFLFRWEETRNYSYLILEINKEAGIAICDYNRGDSRITGPVPKALIEQMHRTRKPNAA